MRRCLLVLAAVCVLTSMASAQTGILNLENRWTRLQHFLGGIDTERFRMRPGGRSSYVLVSDAEGDGSWQSADSLGFSTVPPSPALGDYFYLPGRAGGQRGYGGTGISDILKLIGTTHVGSRRQVLFGEVDGEGVSILAGGGTLATTGRIGVNIAASSVSGSVHINEEGGTAPGIVVRPHATGTGNAFQVTQPGGGVLVFHVTTNGRVEQDAYAGQSAGTQHLIDNAGGNTASVLFETRGATSQAGNLFQATTQAGLIPLAVGSGAPGDTVLSSSYTETSQTANANGIWQLSPTLSSSGTVGNQTMLKISPTVGNLGALQTFKAISLTPTVTPSANSSSIQTLEVSPTIAGTANVTTSRGINAAVAYNSSGVGALVEGATFAVNANSSAGNVTTLNGLSFSAGHANSASTVTTMNGVSIGLGSTANIGTLRGIGMNTLTITTGTITALNQIELKDASGTGAVTTQTGLLVPNLTKGGTNWSLDIGTADSRFAGNTRFGGTTAPTVAVDVTGSVRVSTLTSGRVTMAGASGVLADDADLTFATDKLTATKLAITQGDIVSGVYTPTRSAEANMDANVTTTQAQYMRVGDVVTVSGRFTADPTTTSTATSFEMTLPVASNIGAVEDLAGTATSGSIASMSGEVIGSVANNTAVVQWIATDVTSKAWSYSFTYRVL